MGYRSQVKILMGPKAFELLKENCLKHDLQIVRDMVDPEQSFVEIEKQEDESVLIGWNSVKWQPYYEDIKTIENSLKELNEIVENDCDGDKLEDYFYKLIQIGEDNRCEESTNDPDEQYVSDFYVDCSFSM